MPIFFFFDKILTFHFYLIKWRNFKLLSETHCLVNLVKMLRISRIHSTFVILYDLMNVVNILRNFLLWLKLIFKTINMSQIIWLFFFNLGFRCAKMIKINRLIHFKLYCLLSLIIILCYKIINLLIHFQFYHFLFLAILLLKIKLDLLL